MCAFDVIGIEGGGVASFEDVTFAAGLTFGLLLLRLGIIQVNLISPLAAPSVSSREVASGLQVHRRGALLLWNFLCVEVALLAVYYVVYG